MPLRQQLGFIGLAHKVIDGRGADGVHQASRDLNEENDHQNRRHPGRWVRREAGVGKLAEASVDGLCWHLGDVGAGLESCLLSGAIVGWMS